MEPHPILLELEQHARKDGVALISRETGRFLSTMVTAMQANRILEIGTGYGYSTLWMALAQPRMGHIWTIERDADHGKVALSYFRRAGEDDYIELFNTPATELLENFPQRNLDIVFVAGGNEDYCRYLELVIPMLKLSGLAIFSDCLPARDFVQRFLTHPALDATILPLGEGTGIGARRK
ncbi:MAG TPA: class I SAM-dependent methyltransferase [Candidatus Cybelea sp.]|nr:class I SAM-dependent methyltransferase [Candidatus Cybelea sp.]